MALSVVSRAVAAGLRVATPAAASPGSRGFASAEVGRVLRFRFDSTSGRTLLQIIDRGSGELVRLIPDPSLRAIQSARLYGGIVDVSA